MRIPIYIFFFIFVLSGFSGLIYESIWSHYLKLFLGHAAYAQTLVLSMFMGGMAIGSAIASKLSARWKNLLIAYAIVEAIIGMCAILFHQIFLGAVDIAFSTLIPAFSGNSMMITFTKWGLSSLIILPQSILLGMTFPLMVAGVLRKYPEAGGRAISILYFTNSIGGVFGVLASSFIFIEHFGLPGTVIIAGLINLALAFAIWLFSAGDSFPQLASENNKTSFNISGKSLSMPIILLSVAMFTGLSSFMYEIGWIRMLSLVLGSSTHSFELMLAVFILGIALGGWWLRNRINHLREPIMFLGYVQILMGLFAVFSLVVYHYSFDVMVYFNSVVQSKESTYILYLLLSVFICLIMMLPATICAGMTLPLITKMAINSEVGERGIGLVYALNTIGAILGIFLSVHLVMPAFGFKTVITSGAVIDLLLGIFLIAYLAERKTQISRLYVRATMFLTAIIVISVSVFDFDERRLSSGVFRKGALLTEGEMKFYRDGKTSTVSVHKSGDHYALINNGKTDATINKGDNQTKDEATQVLLGILPLLHHDTATTAAIIGMGSGLTTHAALSSKSLTRVDTIEIERAVIEASHLFRPNVERAYTDIRSKIHIEDAKTFFTGRSEKYDIIVSEPPNPWVSGVASLFTQEFYKQAKKHMSDDGLFVQWLQIYELDIYLVASVFNALNRAFSDYRVYASSDNGDVIIIANKQGEVPTVTYADDVESEVRNMLSDHDINNQADLELHLIGTKKNIGPAFTIFSSDVNSDYFPTLEYGAARARYAKSNAIELINIINYSVPVMGILNETPRVLSSQYTRTSTFFAAVKTQAAEISKKIFLDENVVDSNFDRKAEYRYLFTNGLKHMLSDCAAIDEQRVVNVLHTFSTDLLSYLSAPELTKIWDKIERSKCYRQTDNNSALRQWVALYRAISERRSSEFVELSESLMSLTPRSEKKLTLFLTMTGLLGNHIEGYRKSDEILGRWDKNWVEKLSTSDAASKFLVAVLVDK